MTSLDTIRTALEHHGSRIVAAGQDRFTAQCPAHEDRTPSLSVTYDGDKTLMKCQAGCDTNEGILAVLGLTYNDMFDGDIDNPKYVNTTVATYTYVQPDGQPYMFVERKAGKRFLQGTFDGGNKQYKLPDGFKRCLYRLDKVVPTAQAGGDIWIVEGEKDVHALETRGIVATTMPGGVGTGWQTYYSGWLEGAGSITVVADKDGSGAGLAHARKVVAALEAKGHRPRLVQAREGKDAFDHVSLGLGVDEFIEVAEEREFELFTGTELESIEFPPQEWIVDGFCLRGSVSMLFAPPKMHKSFLVHDIALAVATGGRAIGSVPCIKGAAIYLSVDNDQPRRLQERQDRLLGHVPLPDDAESLYYSTDFPYTEDAAVAQVRKLVRSDPAVRLVIVDTIAKLEPRITGETNSYQVTGEIIARWVGLAATENVHIILVHHDRKAEASDWMDKALGSRNISGSVGAMFYIEAKRGAGDGVLHVIGRDVLAQDLSIRKVGVQWQLFDIPDTLRNLGMPQQKVIGFIRERAAEGETTEPSDLFAQFPEMPEGTVRQYLARAEKKGRIQRLSRGEYTVAL